MKRFLCWQKPWTPCGESSQNVWLMQQVSHLLFFFSLLGRSLQLKNWAVHWIASFKQKFQSQVSTSASSRQNWNKMSWRFQRKRAWETKKRSATFHLKKCCDESPSHAWSKLLRKNNLLGGFLWIFFRVTQKQKISQRNLHMHLQKHEGPLADILFIQNGSMHCQPLRQNTGETSQLCLLAAPWSCFQMQRIHSKFHVHGWSSVGLSVVYVKMTFPQLNVMICNDFIVSLRRTQTEKHLVALQQLFKRLIIHPIFPLMWLWWKPKCQFHPF